MATKWIGLHANRTEFVRDQRAAPRDYRLRRPPTQIADRWPRIRNTLVSLHAASDGPGDQSSRSLYWLSSRSIQRSDPHYQTTKQEQAGLSSHLISLLTLGGHPLLDDSTAKTATTESRMRPLAFIRCRYRCRRLGVAADGDGRIFRNRVRTLAVANVSPRAAGGARSGSGTDALF
jgi:hypothetical protein